MIKLFLVRHGEAMDDVNNTYGGAADDDPTPKGLKSAEELGEKLKNKKIQVLYCSPYKRARLFAQVLGKKLNLKPIVVRDLRERSNYGILTGMNKDEAKKKFPELVEKVKAPFALMDDREPYNEFYDRIVNAFEKIFSGNKGKTICIVTHGGPIHAFMRYFNELGEKSTENFPLDNADFFELKIGDKK